MQASGGGEVRGGAECHEMPPHCLCTLTRSEMGMGSSTAQGGLGCVTRGKSYPTLDGWAAVDILEAPLN